MKSWKKVLSACLAVLMLTGCSAATQGSSASDTGKENSSASGTESSAADDGWTLAATDPWAAYPETITYTVGKAAPDAGYSGLDGTEYEGDNRRKQYSYPFLREAFKCQNEACIFCRRRAKHTISRCPWHL